MSSLLITLLIGILPIPVIYLFYRRHFATKPDFFSHLEHFAYGVILAGVLFFVGMQLKPLITTNNPLLLGFINAALTEKLGAFLLIAILIFKIKKNFTVMNAVVSAMFLGLGFAALENILYAITKH